MSVPPLDNSLPHAKPETGNDLRALPLVQASIQLVVENPSLLWLGAVTSLTAFFAYRLSPAVMGSWVTGHPSIPVVMPSTGRVHHAVASALTGFLSSWARVAVVLAVGQILRSRSWSLSSVRADLRRKWPIVSGFAALVGMSTVPRALSGAHPRQHMLALFLGLISSVLVFCLGLGEAVVANERIGAIRAARRSIVLVASAWRTRVRGWLAIGVPLVLLMVVGTIVGHTLHVPAITAVAFPVGSIPVVTIVAIFDTLLYLRLVKDGPQESSVAPDPPTIPEVP